MNPSRQECTRRPRPTARRSRKGCAGCRVRKVKCDEAKPLCERCQRAHITCAYLSSQNGREIQSAHEELLEKQAESQIPPRTTTASRNIPRDRSHVNDALPGFSVKDLEYLQRFQDITIESFGGAERSAVYRHEFNRLATSHHFLFHAAITCTSMLGRFLTGQCHEMQTMLETYHWRCTLALFNDAVSHRERFVDGSALWMTAVMISFVACFSIEEKSSANLTPSDANSFCDFSWLRTHKGVRLFYDALHCDNPFKRHSRRGEHQLQCLGLEYPESGAGMVPGVLATVCNLDESSNAQQNCYHDPAHALSALLREQKPGPLRFLAFINAIDLDFIASIEAKDPIGLVLMAIWYSCVPRSAWWLQARSQLENHTIRSYLKQQHGQDAAIQAALATFT